MSAPVDVRKFLKRVMDPNLVVPHLIAANAGLDLGTAKKRANVRLSGQALEQCRKAQPFPAFRPDCVNINRREYNSATGIKRYRDSVIAKSLGKHPRFLDRSSYQAPMPPFTGIRRHHVVLAVTPKNYKVGIVRKARNKPRKTICQPKRQKGAQYNRTFHRSVFQYARRMVRPLLPQLRRLPEADFPTRQAGLIDRIEHFHELDRLD